MSCAPNRCGRPVTGPIAGVPAQRACRPGRVRSRAGRRARRRSRFLLTVGAGAALICARARQPDRAGGRERNGRGDRQRDGAHLLPGEAAEPRAPGFRLREASSPTRSRSASPATGRAARSSEITSAAVIAHPLLESLQCPAQPGRDRRRAHSEHRAAASPSRSRTIRRASTSARRPIAPQVLARARARGPRRSASCASGAAARSSRRERRASARNQSSAVVRAIPRSQVKALHAVRRSGARDGAPSRTSSC